MPYLHQIFPSFVAVVHKPPFHDYHSFLVTLCIHHLPHPTHRHQLYITFSHSSHKDRHSSPSGIVATAFVIKYILFFTLSYTCPCFTVSAMCWFIPTRPIYFFWYQHPKVRHTRLSLTIPQTHGRDFIFLTFCRSHCYGVLFVSHYILGYLESNPPVSTSMTALMME
ncbi:hypothetical protein BJ912DRAFT_338655 [Pholiota molesta]|nr:hypothetical protein BJ912DRAFT_338655 [Pholiota molesta]